MIRNAFKIALSVFLSVVICAIQDELNPSDIRCPFWETCIQKTIIFAPVLWLFINLPDAIRKHRIDTCIKRGLCPKCAYPVGTNQVCTECGAAVVKQKAETQKAEIA